MFKFWNKFSCPPLNSFKFIDVFRMIWPPCLNCAKLLLVFSSFDYATVSAALRNVCVVGNSRSLSSESVTQPSSAKPGHSPGRYVIIPSLSYLSYEVDSSLLSY